MTLYSLHAALLWLKYNVLDLYPGGAIFESPLENEIQSLRYFMAFLKSRILHRFGHERSFYILPNSSFVNKNFDATYQ